MPEKNKKSSPEDLGPFFIATLCALLFVALWGIRLFDGFQSVHRLREKMVALMLFGWPILLIVGIVGIICSVCIIKKLPSLEALGYCYIFIIVGYIAWLINGLMSFAGSGP